MGLLGANESMGRTENRQKVIVEGDFLGKRKKRFLISFILAIGQVFANSSIFAQVTNKKEEGKYRLEEVVVTAKSQEK